MKLFLTFLFWCAAMAGASAQPSIRNPSVGTFNRTNAPSGGGGGGGTFALIDHQIANGAASATVTITTTGAKLICISETWFIGPDVITTGTGDIATLLTAHGDTPDASYSNRVSFIILPNTTGGSTTITLTATLCILEVASFSYSGSAPAFVAGTDVGYNKPDGANVMIFPVGSLVPGGNNRLFFVGGVWNNPMALPTMTVDSSFTTLDQSQQGVNNIYGGAGYKIQTTGATETPGLTFDNPVNTGAASGGVWQ